LIVDLTRQRGMATILITHDLGLAATYCDQVVVMEKGRVVETADSRKIFTAPVHPYTRKLMRATPRPDAALRDLLPEDAAGATGSVGSLSPLGERVGVRGLRSDRETATPMLVVEKLTKEYPRKGLPGRFSRMFQRRPAPEPDTFRAVDGVSFTIGRGESVGL